MIRVLLAILVLAANAPAYAAPPPCRGTKVRYKGKCMYPEEARRLKARDRANRKPSSGIASNLRQVIKRLRKHAKKDFVGVAVDGKEDDNGNRFYSVKGKLDACGPNTNYERIWHWRALKGNWEYVCDVQFGNRKGARRYFDAMERVLRKTKGFKWQTARIDDTTIRRLVGLQANPPLKILLDLDVETDGFEVELWFKQNRQPAAPATATAEGTTPQRFARVVAHLVQGGPSAWRALPGGQGPCGPGAPLEDVRRDEQGATVYFCGLAFDGHRTAERPYELLAGALRRLPGFSFSQEKWVSKMTRRRIEAVVKRTTVRLDYDVHESGTITVMLALIR